MSKAAAGVLRTNPNPSQIQPNQLLQAKQKTGGNGCEPDGTDRRWTPSPIPGSCGRCQGRPVRRRTRFHGGASAGVLHSRLENVGQRLLKLLHFQQ